MLTDQEIAQPAKKYSLEGFLKRHPLSVNAISLSELETECRAFEEWEPRESMYRVSTFLVREWWCDPAKLVDALSVLLLIWNGAFYRYGTFDEAVAESCLQENGATLTAFREREISTFSGADEADAGRLSTSFQRHWRAKSTALKVRCQRAKRFICWPQISFRCGTNTSGQLMTVRMRVKSHAWPTSYSCGKFEVWQFN
ncbi:MAG: hypothetical protein LAO78_28495 [Acidobacteriia bacterium]|nr:hypothetical protein [Terriglobia bacterium]